MSRERVVDFAERELAATDLATTYLVEAAAGTGKTTLLVRRVLHILQSTLTPISRIVAITFTEKAAGELKQRIRMALEAELAAKNDEEGHFEIALRDLDRMPVSTIHAFCREILADYAIQAGLDPEFKLLDKSVSEQLCEETFKAWLRVELEQPPSALRQVLEVGFFEGTAKAIKFCRQLFGALVRERAELERLHVPVKSCEKIAELIDLFVVKATQVLEKRAACSDPDDNLLRQLNGIADWLAQKPAFEVVTTMQWLLSVPTINKSKKGNAKKWPQAQTLEELRAYFLNNWDSRIGELRGLMVSLLAADLVGWLKSAVLAFANAKLARGMLDFDDLLIHTRDLLRGQQGAREVLKARFDYLLIDEFQDTDPLQTEIMFFLAERSAHFADEWQHVELEPGKLFIVGDPKQSIYRFRRADIELYRAVRAKIAAADQVLQIRVNFRSVPALLREINALFEPLMQNTGANLYEPDYVALAAPSEAAGAAEPALCILSSDHAAVAEMSAAERMAFEARLISQYIAREVQEQRFALRDIAILIESRTHLSTLETALRADNIPFQTFGGREFGRRMEILALRTLLAAIDNPFDEIAVTGALRQPVFACSDPELVEHRIAAPGFNYLNVTSEIESIARAFELLRKWHRMRAACTPGELVAVLFQETVMLPLAALAPHGEIRVANLYKALELARAFSESGPATLAAYLSALKRFEDVPSETDDPIAAESGDDVVSLMTIHKAKGLEFPCVILYGTTQTNRPNAPPLIERRNGTVELRVAAAIESSGYGTKYQEEIARERAEKKRLLYVAMTRAKQRLVIPVFSDDTASADAAQTMAGLLSNRYTGTLQTNGDWQRHVVEMVDQDTTAQRHVMIEVPDVPDAADLIAADEALRTWQNSLQMLRATFQGPVHARPITVAANVSASTQDGESALRIGNAVHRVLEQIELSRDPSKKLIEELLAHERELRPSERERAIHLLEQVWRSAQFRELMLSAKQIWREVPFAFVEHGELREGKLDLLIEAEDCYHIVDYKTDLVTREQDREQRHRGQLDLYRRALQAVLPDARLSASVFYLESGSWVTID